MSFRAMLYKRSSTIVILLGLAAFQSAWGQAANAPINFANHDAITATLVPPPNLGGMASSGSSSGNNNWLKVELHYNTTAVVTKDYPYVDDVQIKVWIEGRDLYAKNAPPGGKGVAVCLTGSVDYINVPIGRDLYGVFYVPPSVLARYGTDRGPESFGREFDIHAEVYAGGTLVDSIDKNKEQVLTWYQQPASIPNLVLRQDQTPFIVVDSSRYPMIKPTTGQ